MDSDQHGLHYLIRALGGWNAAVYLLLAFLDVLTHAQVGGPLG